jgi:hypothetical protein
MRKTLLMTAAASTLVLASGAFQTAQAQRGGSHAYSGQNWGGHHHHRHGGWGGGWGWGAGALIGGVAALATAPFWAGGYYADPYYGYGYAGYPDPYAGYGYAAPVYYEEPYVTYAPQRVVYTTRIVRPRNVVRVRYAAPRRVIHRAAYRPHAQRIVIRDGVRRSGRVIVR